jgi:hypothetical protein
MYFYTKMKKHKCNPHLLPNTEIKWCLNRIKLMKVSKKHTCLKPNSRTYNFVEVSGHNLIVLRLEVSVYNIFITNQFQTTFARGCGGGGGSNIRSRTDCE